MPDKKEMGGRKRGGQKEGGSWEEGGGVTYSLRVHQSGGRQHGEGAEGCSRGICSRDAEEDELWSSTCFLLCTQGGTPDHRMEPPTFMCIFSLQLARPRNLEWLGVAPLLVCLVLIALGKKMF